ncbi:MAG: OmcA/MtrC family decaheme c-type cytochrome [Polyangiaceae bacterium]|nr:OmcA/MtrC family decaheme c-type cytochrome [Polyangiaceae bacterium]
MLYAAAAVKSMCKYLDRFGIRALLSLTALLAACEGPAGTGGGQGPRGPSGDPGDPGAPVEPGPPGDPGPTPPTPYATEEGLKIEITGVTLAAGEAQVTFKLTDGAGTPLDMDGVLTEGAVTPRFVLAWLDQNAQAEPLQYTAYTTKDQTSPITGDTATQAAADEGGTFEDVDLAQGIYRYTLAAPVAPAAATRTHTLGAWAARDYEGKRYVADAVHHFVPDGSAVTVKKDIVRTDACNACHNPLKAHGGQRRDVELCVLCHSPQTTDPDTGNTVDMGVMTHKIHRGHSLPSVVAGTPYQIVGYGQSVHDYSTVGYPQEVQNCNSCHTGTQGEYWRDRPNFKDCVSCHDLTSFVEPAPAGMTLHVGGAQADETNCKVCHPASGGLEGITQQHLSGRLDPAAPVIAIDLSSVESTAPGQTPQIVFTVTQDGIPVDILATPLTRLVVTVGGPTADYAGYWQHTIQGSGASGTITSEGNGAFRYTFPAPMPAAATGTYAVGMEGYIQPGGSSGPRFAAENPVVYAAVTDPAPVPRRAIVDDAQCDRCHRDLQAHGGGRKSADYCAICHNPNNVNDDRVARFESSTILVESVAMPAMIHRIHMGEELTQPYVLGGNPAPTKANPAGNPIDFREVRYPGDRRACWACHTAESHDLPLPLGLLPSRTQMLECIEDPAADADGYCDLRQVKSETLLPAATAACTGCHDAPEVLAHAQTNTAASGVEACSTCHGPGKDSDVQAVHALDP